MEVIFHELQDMQIVADVVIGSPCLETPRVKAETGIPIPQSALDKLNEVKSIINRRGYIDTLLAFIDGGLQTSSGFITSLYIGANMNSLYGVSADRTEFQQLLTREAKVDLFDVIEPPDQSVLMAYTGFFSNGKLSTRDCIGFYPITVPEETVNELRQSEQSLAFQVYINNFINRKKDCQQMQYPLTIENMLERLDKKLGWKNLFAACYYNVEGFKDVTEIPVIQQRVIKEVEPEYVQYYIYMLNLILNKEDDLVAEKQLLITRFLLGHTI